MDEKFALKIFEGIVKGVVHAHSKGYAFRNLSSKNIFFDQSFNIKIANFDEMIPIKAGRQSGKAGLEENYAPEMILPKGD